MVRLEQLPISCLSSATPVKDVVMHPGITPRTQKVGLANGDDVGIQSMSADKSQTAGNEE